MTGKFRIFVVSNDRRCRQRALGLCSRLIEQFDSDLEIVTDFWEMERMRFRGVQDAALERARSADVLVVAIGDDNELSVELKTLLDGWSLADRKTPAAVVGLFGTRPAPRIAAYVQSVARKAGAEFFSPDINPSEPTFTIQSTRSSVLDPASTTRKKQSSPVRHWGINE